MSFFEELRKKTKEQKRRRTPAIAKCFCGKMAKWGDGQGNRYCDDHAPKKRRML